MGMSESTVEKFVGMDVSKTALDVCVQQSGQALHVAYDEAGIGRIVECLQEARPALIVMEATGGMVSRRRQLIAMRVQETLRLGTAASRPMQKSLNKHIAWLDKQIAEVDGDLSKHLRGSDVWGAQDDLLGAIAGGGPIA